MKDSYKRVDELFSEEELDKSMKFEKFLNDSINEFTKTNFKDDFHKISACTQLLGASIISLPLAQIKYNEMKEKYISNCVILIRNIADIDQKIASRVKE
jgi:hypothetical protein